MKNFLEKLETRLSILAELERKKILKKYQTEIEKKMKAGKSEEEAIEILGPIDNIVKDIYEEYHLNDRYSSRGKIFSEVIRDGVTSFAGVLTAFCKDLASRVKESNNENTLETFFEVFLKIILFIMAIMVLKLPFIIIEEIFGPLFDLLFYPFNTALDWILHFVLTIIYIACTVGLGVAMFKDYARPKIAKENKEPKIKAEEKKTTNNEKIEEQPSHMLFAVIKMILFVIIIIPMLVVNLSFLLLTLIAAFLVYKGVGIIGLAIILFGLFLLTSTVTNYITDALDNKVRSHIIKIIVSVVAIVVGSILFIDNIFQFNYNEDIYKSSFIPAISTYTIDIEDAVGIVSSYDDIKIEIDNGMVDNKLLIEVTYYSEIVDMNVSLETGKNRDFVAIYTTRKSLSMDILRYIYNNAIEDLKHDNIFDYRDLEGYKLTIYCNEKTRELIP